MRFHDFFFQTNSESFSFLSWKTLSFWSCCQYRDKKALFTDPIFREGFDYESVAPALQVCVSKNFWNVRACERYFCSRLVAKRFWFMFKLFNWLLSTLSFRIILVDGGSSVGSGPLMSPGLWKTPASSAGAGQSTVMAELTNLVNAHPRAGMQAGKDQMRT